MFIRGGEDELPEMSERNRSTASYGKGRTSLALSSLWVQKEVDGSKYGS